MSLTPGARYKAMRLLNGIHEKTGGRSRGVRDVAELETGLTQEESKAAWGDLLVLGLIERFSQEFAARLSVAGVNFIESGRLVAELSGGPPPAEPLRSVFIVRGPGVVVGEAVAQFVEEIHCRAVLLDDPARSIMEQVEAHADVGFAIVLLTTEELGGTAELRPRLNVLMDLGYLLGRLGRANVCAFAVDSELDLPRDMAGVALDSLDASGKWKSTLARLLTPDA